MGNDTHKLFAMQLSKMHRPFTKRISPNSVGEDRRRYVIPKSLHGDCDCKINDKMYCNN